MRNMPKLVMGVTLIMGVSLLLVLALVLVLLAELYCSLLRKRRPRIVNTAAAQQGKEEGLSSATSIPLPMTLCPGSSAYAHGVLRAPPRGFLFPIIKEEQQQQQGHQPSGTSLHFMGLISTPSSPQLTTVATTLEENNYVIEEDGCCSSVSAASGREHFVYISNPIYDDEARVLETPFETPDSSPSRLPSDADDPPMLPRSPNTPPLTPMKKLPLMASSVTLMDGRSLVVSVSATDSNAGSSSSSGSPFTSPSW